jgi:hypothetical protein
MHEISEQSPVVAIEKRFQLPDVAGPDFQHDGLVYHAPRFRIWILMARKKVTTQANATIGVVDPADIRAFVDRDWALIAQAKEDQWLEQKRSLTPSAAIALAAGLYQYAKALKPDWPDPAEREADLASHIRMAELLRRVDEQRTR